LLFELSALIAAQFVPGLEQVARQAFTFAEPNSGAIIFCLQRE
jgi:hypothetical protein